MPTANVTRRWLFGGQLGPHFLDDPEQPALLVDSSRVFARRTFHRANAHLVLSVMRHRAAELGEQCHYVQAEAYRQTVSSAGRLTEVTFVGDDGPRRFAATRVEALRVLHDFILHRLADFGPYEDAMLVGDWHMAHSTISAPLNLGCSTRSKVGERVETAYRDGSVPLASAEGFIRQVIGWRDYVWHLYWHFGEEYRHRNALHATTPVPQWFWDRDADAEPQATGGSCIATASASPATVGCGSRCAARPPRRPRLRRHPRARTVARGHPDDRPPGAKKYLHAPGRRPDVRNTMRAVRSRTQGDPHDRIHQCGCCRCRTEGEAPRDVGDGRLPRRRVRSRRRPRAHAGRGLRGEAR